MCEIQKVITAIFILSCTYPFHDYQAFRARYTSGKMVSFRPIRRATSCILLATCPMGKPKHPHNTKWITLYCFNLILHSVRSQNPRPASIVYILGMEAIPGC